MYEKQKTTVLQINSLEALERLIGGDGKLEVDVRNSIVQAFANKHLTKLADIIADRCVKDLTRQIETIVAERLTGKAVPPWVSGKIQLSDEYKQAIKQQVDIVIGSSIKGIVDTTAADLSAKANKEFNDRFQVHGDYIDKKLAQLDIMNRVEAKVEECFRAMLSKLVTKGTANVV